MISAVISDMFLVWMAAFVCLMAALERPDRRAFWLACLYACGVVDVAHFVIGAA